jgi:pimeloyl-ACP methyl ester carboxylesterase
MLLGRPLLIPLAERLGRRLLQRRGVRTRHVATPEGHVHVFEAKGGGDLPTIVLLHGISSTGLAFAALLQRLLPHASRILVPDYPGHGFSDEPTSRLTPAKLFSTMSAAIEELAPEKIILIGNSLGGAVALHHAITRPDHVKALVLLSPAGAHASDDEWIMLRRMFDIATRAEAIAFLDRIYHKTPWPMRLLAHEMPAAFNRQVVRDLLASASNADAVAPDALRALRMPVLFFWGRSERLLPDTFLDWFEKHLPPHAVIDRPEGFGHCPHFDSPSKLAARIAEFLRGSLAEIAQKERMEASA